MLSESHEKYGPIVKLWLGPTKLLVSAKDPMLIQEMLIKADDKLPFTGKAFHLAFGQSSLFAPSYEKVLNCQFFSHIDIIIDCPYLVILCAYDSLDLF